MSDKKRITGIYQTLSGLNYFIPNPLPPKNPAFQMTPEIMDLYGQANLALGKLNEISLKFPDQRQFIKSYIIKEAILSSSIEGIHTTLLDTFTHTLDDTSKPSKDTQLVLNYVDALETALTMMQDQGWPLVTRVILKAHEALLSDGDGDRANPGRFRQQSVRVGHFIPSPASDVQALMGDLEKYMNDTSTDIPPLIKAGLVHVQFETIHPFLDGNGRIGRLLIVLMLLDNNILTLPILYPSYYFKKHHYEYYQRLDLVRSEGDFEGWITYYLKGICQSAQDAYARANDIQQLRLDLKNRIEADTSLSGLAKENITNTLTFLFQEPIVSITRLSEKLSVSFNTAQKHLSLLMDLKIVTEITTNKRGRRYVLEPYMALLEKEYA